MKEFGFSISSARTIDLEKCDSKILLEIEKAIPSFKKCMSCGSCTATCSSQQYTSFNLRKVFSLIKQKQYENVEEELKKCMLCGKCTLICPRGVETRATIVSIRKIINKNLQ